MMVLLLMLVIVGRTIRYLNALSICMISIELNLTVIVRLVVCST
jgi:hypothetical protein